MQTDADTVEKDILWSEERLAVVRTQKRTNDTSHSLAEIGEIKLSVACFHQDAENEKKDLPFQHQDEISDKLGEAEALLKNLFLDVDKAKKLKHPQAKEIESEWVVSVWNCKINTFSIYRKLLQLHHQVST